MITSIGIGALKMEEAVAFVHEGQLLLRQLVRRDRLWRILMPLVIDDPILWDGNVHSVDYFSENGLS